MLQVNKTLCYRIIIYTDMSNTRHLPTINTHLAVAEVEINCRYILPLIGGKYPKLIRPNILQTCINQLTLSCLCII